MALTNFPSGISSMGVPVVGAGSLPIPRLNGVYLFVDSNNGNNSNNGLSVDKAFSTLEYAVGKCTANRGDVIVCLPGHTETVSSAGALDLDVAGITIIGQGRGSTQAKIVLDTATSADIDIDAADITIIGMHFTANYADIVAAIDVNADDFTISRCRFSETAASMNALIWVQDAASTASDRIIVEYCDVRVLDASNTHFINFAGTGDGHVVRHNMLLGDWGTMAIGGAGVVTFAACYGNRIYNVATTSDACIHFAATATGLIMDNLCGGGAAQANGVSSGTMATCENYYGNIAEDLSGILDPVGT
jgi:hypothetical protein